MNLRSAMALGTLAVLPCTIAASPPPSALDFYKGAYDRMRAEEQPEYATYTTTIHTAGSRLIMSRDTKNGDLEAGLSLGRPDKPGSWEISLRSADESTSTALTDGTHGISRFPLFNPTWGGAYEMMRYGWDGPPDPTPTPGGAAKKPAPAPSDEPVIAVVKAISPGFYRIEDGGPDTCEDGSEAHRVHLIAYHDPIAHPLTDAVIDLDTGDFCQLRFGLHANAVVFGATGEMVLNFSRINSFQLVRDSSLSFDLRAAGIRLKHIAMQIDYSHFQFPAAIPDAVFTPQTGSAR